MDLERMSHADLVKLAKLQEEQLAAYRELDATYSQKLASRAVSDSAVFAQKVAAAFDITTDAVEEVLRQYTNASDVVSALLERGSAKAAGHSSLLEPGSADHQKSSRSANNASDLERHAADVLRGLGGY